METYEVVELKNGQFIVLELNANVAILTFPKGVQGERIGDLYNSPHEAPLIVARDTCAPVNAKFIKPIILIF